MNLCGIDLSSYSIAVGLLNNDEVVSIEVFADKKNNFDSRFDELTERFFNLFIQLNPDAVYIEAIPYVKSAQTALVLASVLGMIRAVCRLQEIPYHVVHNLSWKKGIGLKGRVAKEDTKNLMINTYSIDEPLSENQYDALGVMTYGNICERATRSQSLNSDATTQWLEQSTTAPHFAGQVRTGQETVANVE